MKKGTSGTSRLSKGIKSRVRAVDPGIRAKAVKPKKKRLLRLRKPILDQ